jgi:hypothetical protein
MSPSELSTPHVYRTGSPVQQAAWRRLSELGYEEPRAVADFQAANGLKIDGVIGPKTLGALYAPEARVFGAVEPRVAPPQVWLPRDLKDFAPPPYVRGGRSVVSEETRLPEGLIRSEIARLQDFLNAEGYTDDQGRSLAVDGDFGLATRQAFAAYRAASQAGNRGAAAADDAATDAILSEARAVIPGFDLEKNASYARQRAGLPFPFRDLLFLELVDYGQDWDYKKYGRAFYELGNFHYGVVGSALGYSPDVLLRMAGWAQPEERSDPAWGSRPSAWNARLGVGGASPFGDDPEDQKWILRGVDYYRRHSVGGEVKE